MDKIIKLINDSFLATNTRINELISVTTSMRDQFSYLKGEIRASNQRLEKMEGENKILKNQVNELRVVK